MSGVERAADLRLETAVRFHHPEKSPDLIRMHATALDVAPVVARELGVTIEQLADERRMLADRAVAAAHEVLARPGIESAVGAIPFRRGDVIVALGDSVTDDLLSWAHQLEALLAAALPELELRVVNAGRSGDTTAQVIDRLDLLIAERPAWVIQLLGTNDARRHGRAAHRVFAPEETARNFETIREIVSSGTGARLIRMTPAPIIVERISSWEPFTAQQISWRADEVSRIAADLLAADAAAVDLQTGMLGDAHLLLGEDGLHPGVEGQQRILELLVLALSGRSRA